VTRSQRERIARTSLRARLAGALVPAAIAAGGVVLLFSDARPGAPFSGLTLTAVAIALVATGYVGRGFVGVLLAVAAGALGLAVDELITQGVDGDGIPPDDACDPGCGYGWSLGAIALVPPLVLAAVGAGARALVERRRGSRRQPTP
jgi:hypothetical protein